MTNTKNFKKLVRERMAKTGERYSTAMMHLQAQKNGAPPTLADKMRDRPPPTEEAFNKGFGQTRAVGDGEQNGGRFAIEDAECSKETDDGIRVKSDFFKGRPFNDNWIPKEQILAESDVHKLNDKGNLVVTLWLARQRGWAS